MKGTICIKIDKINNKSSKEIMDESIQVLADYWQSKGFEFDIGYNPEYIFNSEIVS